MHSSIKPLPEFLRQPIWLSAIASVGFHGVLFAVLPVLPMTSRNSEPDIRRPVRVVELNPAEQTRLPPTATNVLPPLQPDVSTLPSFNFPSLPSQTDLFPLPSTQQPNFQLPDTGPLYTLPPTTSPSITLPPTAIAPTTAPSWSFAPPIQIPPLSIARVPEIPGVDLEPDPLPSVLPSLPPGSTLPPVISLPDVTVVPTTPTRPDPDATPQPDAPPEQARPETIPPAAIAYQQEKIREYRERLAQTPPASPDPDATPAAEPTPTPDSARPQAVPPAAIAYQQEKIREYREKFARDNTNTSPEEVSDNISTLVAQAEAVAADTPEATLATEYVRQEIADFYPEEACPAKIKGEAWVGVVVNPDGQLEGQPKILQSSGYRLLNQAALNHVSNQKLEGNGQYQPTIFTFKFEPEAACPAESEAPVG